MIQWSSLTQAEMDELHAYATAKGIGLIAAVNSPGHMDAFVGCHGKLGIENPQASFDTVSKTTMDLTNEAAVNFTKALIGKYMDYFKDKSKIFNYGQMNMPMTLPVHKVGTTSSGMTSMVNLRSIPIVLQPWRVKKACSQMAFNDGFYYGDEDDVAFDKDVLISYWSKGWWGYNLASPQYLADKGYKFLNTNGDWYYAFWEEHLKRVVVILRKRLPMQLLLHLDNSQVQRILKHLCR